MNSPARVSRRSVAARLLACAMAALFVAGCAQIATRPQGADPTAAGTTGSHEVIRQARALAEAGTAPGSAARRSNEAQIERLLSSLDDAALQREARALAADAPLYDYVGRALLRRGLPLPHAFARRGWNFDARPAAERDGYRPPVKLAVLLPLSGSLAGAARPVRDGLLAGYYGEARRRPDIRFYDTAGTPAGALTAYDRASSDGNDFVVGPLGRDEVGALFARGNLGVPMLALNRATQTPPEGHASFSLSPEDEGLAAADYLMQRGARNVLVIASGEETQRRAVVALRERLVARGGNVVDVLADSTTDFGSAAAKPVDAVFLATRGSAARALMPRLQATTLAGKPRVATSQLLAGTGKAADDRVLDGIAFPSEAWLTRGVRGLGMAEATGARLTSARGAAGRLFAFGFDAWLLAAYLDHLGRSAEGSIDGATGVLRLDGFGNVQRTPGWSTFANGEPAPLADAGR